jgi:DNA polymerase III epsilon subunit-like protein
MIFTAFDCETTGFKAGEDRITEIALLKFKYHGPGLIESIANYSAFVWDESYPLLTPEIKEITGITDEILKDQGKPFATVLQETADEYFYPAQFLIAHNAPFDRGFLHAEARKVWGDSPLVNIPFICTMNDIPHPKKFKCRKLSHLALDYGCEVDPKTLHRAMGDVGLMVRMLIAGRIDMAAIAERSSQPVITVRAIVPKPFGPRGDGGVGKDKAKSLGFNWDGTRWIKEIRQNELEQLEKELGYAVETVNS